ncbi:MAG: cytochrome ubiquinol oxidase subunit I [Syntrophaceae bacterium]|nr:cytochrome ubiquinol oxidase subunit I [Syntrophaceae bacterium]
MDAIFLSRLQFAVATLFHFIFVPLTLGLSILVAIMETQYVRTGNEEYKKMAKFWGHLFLINFAVGVVTGITLEFQFGTNWAGYSKYVGDVFGSLLAIEATVAFFLESTFIAIWFFGWDRLSAKAHAACIWLVAIASNLSAYWIIAANAWMQHPVGYEIRNGRAELTDFLAVVTQPYAITNYLHTVVAGFVVAGFFVMGISAYHLVRKNQIEFFTKSFKMAVTFALIFSVAVVGLGDLNGKEMARLQPEKTAAAEALWETTKGADFIMFAIPDEKNERNLVEFIRIPKFMSKLVMGDWDAEMRGLKSWPLEDRPPVAMVYWSFRIMVGIGFLLILLSAYGWLKRNNLQSSPSYLKVMTLAIPLPYIAGLLGWIVTEVGRQPWIVYHVLRTSEAHSPIVASQVGISLVAFIVLYSLLGFAAIFLMARHAKRGPVAH